MCVINANYINILIIFTSTAADCVSIALSRLCNIRLWYTHINSTTLYKQFLTHYLLQRICILVTEEEHISCHRFRSSLQQQRVSQVSVPIGSNVLYTTFTDKVIIDITGIFG